MRLTAWHLQIGQKYCQNFHMLCLFSVGKICCERVSDHFWCHAFIRQDLFSWLIASAEDFATWTNRVLDMDSILETYQDILERMNHMVSCFQKNICTFFHVILPKDYLDRMNRSLCHWCTFSPYQKHFLCRSPMKPLDTAI